MAARKRYTYDYPRPMVTVDAALFRLNGDHIELLLVKRGKEPFKGAWALPGGFIGMEESLEESAIREVVEETGIRDIPYLSRLGAYGDPNRDPRGRVISAAFAGILREHARKPKAGSDAANAAWVSIEAMPAPLAFDHAAIIGDALRKIATLGRTSGALFVFLGAEFTVQDVARLLKALYGFSLDAKEYMTPFMEMGLIHQTGKKGVYAFVEGGRVRRANRRPPKSAKKPVARPKRSGAARKK